jgi:hypothetical protein
MSWLVKDLILNSSNIRKRRVNESNDFYFGADLISLDSINDMDAVEDDYMNTDAYLLLLTLETKISQLLEKGILKQDELELLITVSNVVNLGDVAEILGIHRTTVATRFDKICNKLAYYLGNQYTDLGLINYMKEKYNLTNEQETKLMEFILNG